MLYLICLIHAKNKYIKSGKSTNFRLDKGIDGMTYFSANPEVSVWFGLGDFRKLTPRPVKISDTHTFCSAT